MEAGDELFTFTAFQVSQWKALRTTNALERINEQFRRRTKTQASIAERGSGFACAFWFIAQHPEEMAPADRMARTRV